MKKGDDSPEPRSSPVATHQFSLSSLLLRTSTTSSEAKRNLFYGSSNASKASLESTASTTRLTSDPVIEEDFADVDSSNESNYSEDDARTAESIYSVIQEYELSRSSFWFSENFENSPESARSVEENRDAVVQQTLLSPRIPFTIPEEGQPERAGNASRQAILPDSRQRSPQLRGPIGLSRNIGSPSSEISQQRFGPQQRSQNLPYPNRSPLIDTHEINAFGQTPSPQVSDSVGDSDGTTSSRNSRGNRSSLSSGELLTRLEVTSCKSSLSSKRNSTNSELALQTLIAEVDLETELPVMVYSVHDKNDRQNRWSAYEKTSRASLPQETRQPPAIPIQIREGTSRARRVSVSTVSVSSPSRKVSPGSVASPENTPRARSLIQMNTSNPPIPLRSLSARNSVVRSSNSSLGSNSFVFVNESSGSGSTPKSAATGGTGPNGSSPGVFSNISGGIPENDDGGSPKDNVESTIFDRNPR
ncbi:hypothetical protein JCM33374_g612 [Metschnikowia sp. JCM 33374]|nr:hypothetical protein JCM33374_g612 [Metschnikowia sp. JCM 33374]